MPGLHRFATHAECWMSVVDRSDHILIANQVFAVKRNTPDGFGFQRLQNVHIVSHRRRVRVLLRIEIVPTRPRSALFWQHVRLRVQQCDVPLVRKRRKHFQFGRRRAVPKNSQSLIAVAGKNHVIKFVSLSISHHRNRMWIACVRHAIANHALNGTVEFDPIGPTVGQCFDVLFGSALNHFPLRTIFHAQQPVVFVKLGDESNWEIAKRIVRGRPDRSSHRKKILLNELIRKFVASQK